MKRHPDKTQTPQIPTGPVAGFSEKLYRDIFYNNPLPMWIYDPETLRFLDVNNRAIEKYGYSREEFLQLTLADIRPHKEREKMISAVKSRNVSGYNSSGIWQHMTKSGKLINVEITSHHTEFGNRQAVLVLANDVTERVEAMRLLEKSYQENITILESIRDGFFTMDKQWIVTYWNKEAEKMLGMSRDQILGKNLWERFPDAIDMPAYAHYQKAIKDQVPVHFEDYYAPINMWFDINVYPSENGLSVYFKDITEKKFSEDRVRIAKERYDIVVRVTNDAVWDWDIVKNDVHWGEGFQTLFGYDPANELPTIDFWDSRIHPNDRRRVIENVEKRLLPGDENLIEEEYRFLRADGTYADVLDRGFVMRDKDGKAIRMIGSMKDITERKAASIRLEKSEQGLKQAQAISHIGNWEHSFIEDRSVWSDETYRILDIEPGTPPTLESYLALIHPEDIEHVMEVIREMEKQMQPRSFTHRIVRKDGIRTLYCESRFVYSASGKTIGVYGVLQDITERVQQEQELKKLNEELSNSNKELERFAYIASHDLQEPLRMISSFMQLLQKKYKGKLDDTADQYISYAVDGADRMKQLILDLLEYSRIGTTKEVLIDTDVNDIMSEVLKDLGNKILESGAVVTVQPMPVIKANKTQLRQLFQNLTGNALKYNKSKPPEVEIGVEDKKDRWQFHVKDNGIGIDPKHFDKVFEIFKRLHNKSEFSGTGLGLAICKKIVERHDGKIWIESEPGTGSTFYFTIKK